MSDAIEIYGQLGQTLAVAEATLNRILERHLATHDTPPDRWYALKLIAQGEPIARPALIDALAAGGKVQPVDAEPLLRTLTADGLVAGHDVLSLTDAGRSYFEELRQYVITPTSGCSASSSLPTSRRRSVRCARSPHGPERTN